MSQVPDPDDIFRVIDEDQEQERNNEVMRLVSKKKSIEVSPYCSLQRSC